MPLRQIDRVRWPGLVGVVRDRDEVNRCLLERADVRPDGVAQLDPAAAGVGDGVDTQNCVEPPADGADDDL